MNSVKRVIASFLIVCLSALGLPLQANAGIVSTYDVASAAGERERVAAFFAREDVRKALEARGISSDAAAARVATMTDEEVAQVAGRIDQAPAGGDAVSVLFTIFVVLLITDILGFTKVFPFTRSIR